MKPQVSQGHSCATQAPRYRSFFIAALVMMVAVGVGWGTLLLVRYALAGHYTGLSIFEINAHGHLMISGFIGLFIMGFAYQAFPNLFHHPIVAPKLRPIVCAMMIAGLLLIATGLLFNGFAFAWWMCAVGNVLEIAATLCFVTQLALTFKRGGMPVEAHILFIFTATFFMIASTIASAWLHLQMLSAESRMEVVYYVSTYQYALRNLQLHGMTLLMILGVGHRLLTNFYAFRRTSNRGMIVALALLASSVIAEAVLFVLFRQTEEKAYAKALVIPWIGLIAGVLVVVARWKLWHRPVDEVGRTDRMAPFVQSSFAWLAVALVMMVLVPFWGRIAGTYFSHAFYGASRHAFVFGFATMMIVAFTLRVVPNLNSIVPTGLPMMRGTLWTLNVGCALQIVIQVVGEFVPTANAALPIAGVIEFVGIALWTTHLFDCFRTGAAIRRESRPTRSTRSPLTVLAQANG